MVALLIANTNVNPACESNHAIRYACYHGHGAIVELLLADARVDPTDSDNWAIRTCVALHDSDTMMKRLLADRRVNPNGYATYKEWYVNHPRRSSVRPLSL
jgi:hypothetical protein